jgi:hypothetical protein
MEYTKCVKTYSVGVSAKLRVETDKVSPAIWSVLEPLALLWAVVFPNDADGLTISCGCETSATHTAPHTLHYPSNSPDQLGRALDLRVIDVNTDTVKFTFIPLAKQLILNDDYDIIFETDHVHLEFDKKI